VADDVEYLEARYGGSPAVFRDAASRRAVFFVYDSYHVPAVDWAAHLPKARGVFIGLWLDQNHGPELATAGFDAFYTYFASAGFVFGASPPRWPRMVKEAKALGLGSVLSVGPGYNDERIRPWNRHNTKPRDGGRYYTSMMRAAVEALPDALSVTSYNEWGEGTQIEPAMSSREGYEDYGPAGPYMYLNLTAKWISVFEKKHRDRLEYEGGSEL
jgi:glycoprotein endo-alpha-1,2-mannosidase